jgi:nucleotide-binding universal stress UspA family protein
MIDLRRILVPTDFSPCSQNALAYGAALAEKFGAELVVLHVVQDLAVFIPEAVLGAPPPLPPVQQFIAAARAALDRAIAGLGLSGVAVRGEVGEGPPAEEVVRLAREQAVDLIVMGTYGHTGLAHLLLGSVAERVVRRAPCPVLTVRRPEHEFVHP